MHGLIFIVVIRCVTSQKTQSLRSGTITVLRRRNVCSQQCAEFAAFHRPFTNVTLALTIYSKTDRIIT